MFKLSMLLTQKHHNRKPKQEEEQVFILLECLIFLSLLSNLQITI